MSAIYLANALTGLIASWAVWVRRDSFGSRWDGPMTVGILLYAVAALLDSPWTAVAEASYPLTGKYYLIPALGHIAYLFGTAAGIRSVYVRLVPDDYIGLFMRSRIMPVVYIAAVVMAVCVLASPATSTLSADYLYGLPLDGWLTTYVTTFFLTMTALMALTVFGVFQLRKPPAVAALPLLGGAAVGCLAELVFLAGILSGRSELVLRVAWPMAYIAIIVGSVACASSWGHRKSELTRPADTS